MNEGIFKANDKNIGPAMTKVRQYFDGLYAGNVNSDPVMRDTMRAALLTSVDIQGELPTKYESDLNFLVFSRAGALGASAQVGTLPDAGYNKHLLDKTKIATAEYLMDKVERDPGYMETLKRNFEMCYGVPMDTELTARKESLKIDTFYMSEKPDTKRQGITDKEYELEQTCRKDLYLKDYGDSLLLQNAEKQFRDTAREAWDVRDYKLIADGDIHRHPALTQKFAQRYRDDMIEDIRSGGHVNPNRLDMMGYARMQSELVLEAYDKLGDKRMEYVEAVYNDSWRFGKDLGASVAPDKTAPRELLAEMDARFGDELDALMAEYASPMSPEDAAVYNKNVPGVETVKNSAAPKKSRDTYLPEIGYYSDPKPKNLNLPMEALNETEEVEDDGPDL